MRVYGQQVGHWRAYMDYVTSESATSVTVQIVAAGMQSVAWGYQIATGISTWIAVGEQTAYNGGGGFSSGTGQTAEQSYVSHTYTVPKTTSAQSVSVRVSTTNESGYENGTSEASAVLNIAALASYTVSYNANGGSGAPSAQTKWHGQALTLSSVRPTRSGYDFLGWATSSSGSVAYQPGGSYTANSSATLYARWDSSYSAPTIYGVEAYRCDSSGTPQADGTYVHVGASWRTNSGSNANSVQISYKLASASSWTSAYSANPGAASGSLSRTIGGSLSADSVYDVRVTVADPGGSSSATVQVAGQSVPIYVANKGSTISFGGTATREGVTVYPRLWAEGGTCVAGCQGTNGTSGYFHVATVTIEAAWAGTPLVLCFIRRTDNVPTWLSIRWTHANSTDPTLMGAYWQGDCGDVYVYKSGTGTWEVYVAKGTSSDYLSVLSYLHPPLNSGYTVAFHDAQVSSVPSGYVQASPARSQSSYRTLNSTYGVYASRTPGGTVTVYSQGASALAAGSQWSTVSLGTLPVGWRPQYNAMQSVPCGGGTVYLGVTTAGAVSYTRATATTIAAGVYATLSYGAQS